MTMSSIPDPDDYDQLEDWFADIGAEGDVDQATLEEVADRLSKSGWVE
jgi:DNA-binding MarR family transcriptional regulator